MGFQTGFEGGGGPPPDLSAYAYKQYVDALAILSGGFISANSITNVLLTSGCTSYANLASDVLKSFPVLNTTNKNMVASPTFFDADQACSTPIAQTPRNGGHVTVCINGLKKIVTSDNSGECFFGISGGNTPRSISSILSGDTLRNCVTCCGRCNKAKSIYLLKDFFEWIEIIYCKNKSSMEPDYVI